MTLFGGDRAVAVRLTADIKGYVAGMTAAGKKAQDFGKAAVDAAGKHRRAFNDVSDGALKVGVALGAVGVAAVASFAKFDQAMSRAAAGTGAAGTAMTALRQAALDAGKNTAYSATEAADAITAMGKAGVKTRDILGGGLAGALDLAAAGQLEVGQAAEIAATAMTQFQLKGKDLGHVADLLAAGAGKAQGDVTDLANALKYVGPVAASMGVSIEETTGVLAEFASQGIIGEQAGTSLRGMLGSLTSPSKVAADEIERLGIGMYDAQGSFLGLENVAGQLQTSLAGMTDQQRDAALGTIFGNEQITAAKILYQGGAAAVKDWTAKVNDAGYAQRTAATLTDNLAGDLERLKGSLETTLIETGSGANSSLRTLTQTLDGAVGLFLELPQPVQATATGLGALTAASALGVGVTGKAITGYVDLRNSLRELSVSADGTRTKLGRVTSFLSGPWGIALGVGVTALGIYATQQAAAKAEVDRLTESLDQQTGALTKTSREMLRKELADSGAVDVAKKFGISLRDVQDAAEGNTTALARVNAQLDVYRNADPGKSLANTGSEYNRNATAAKVLSDALDGTNGKIRDAREALKDKKAMLGEDGAATEEAAAQADAYGQAVAGAGTATRLFGGDLGGTTTSAVLLQEAIEKADAAAKGYATTALDARAASRDYQAALDDAAASIKENGRSLDDTTPKGRANAAALDAVAAAAQRQAEAIKANGGTEEDYRASLVRSRAQLVEVATQFFRNKGKAEAYADAVLGIPGRASTTVTLSGAGQVNETLDQIRARVRALTGRRFNIDINARGGTALADGGVLRSYAGGGFENHTAQIARGGPVRIWNEPETAGEAYIPLASSKRARSKAILAETAKILGMVAYADGGFSTATPFGLTDVSQRYEAARLKPISTADYRAAVNASRNAALAQQKAERDLASVRRRTPRDTDAIRDAEARLDRARRASAAARTKEASATARKNAPKGFSLGGYTTALAGTVAQTTAFRGNLKKIAGRGGNQLAALIEGMGDDGIQLAAALAKAKPAEFARVVGLLRQLDPEAFATPAPVVATSGAKVIPFAAGGIENHTAQIARGGPIRMWNEPETGGEAYVPLAASKRGRSRMIASDVVAHLGGTVAWSTARAGGSRSSQSAAPSAAGTVGGPLFHADRVELVRGDPSQVASEIMFRVRAAG